MDWVAKSWEKDDIWELSRFFKINYKGLGSYGNSDLFHWKIANNYIRTGLVNLVKDKGAIAASTSLTPKKIYILGNTEIGGEIGDTYTGQQYQRRGLFSTLVNQTRQDAETEKIELIYGTPNHQSLPGYKKKANFFPHKSFDIRHLILPFRVRRMLPQRIPRLLREFIDFGWSMFLSAYLFLRFKKPAPLTVVDSHVPPADWDKLWSEMKQSFDFIVDRSREGTEWRFERSPNKYRFITVREDGCLKGFIVYRIVMTESLPTVGIADMFVSKHNKNLLQPLISQLCSVARDIDAESIKVWVGYSSEFYNYLRRLCFIDRGKVPIIIFKNRWYDKLTDIKNYHFTMGDSDNI